MHGGGSVPRLSKNTFTSYLEKCGSMTVPNRLEQSCAFSEYGGWGLLLYVYYWGSSTEIDARSVFLIPSTELLP